MQTDHTEQSARTSLRECFAAAAFYAPRDGQVIRSEPAVLTTDSLPQVAEPIAEQFGDSRFCLMNSEESPGVERYYLRAKVYDGKSPARFHLHATNDEVRIHPLGTGISFNHFADLVDELQARLGTTLTPKLQP